MTRKFANSFLMARSFILLLIIVVFRSMRKLNFNIIIEKVINDGSLLWLHESFFPFLNEIAWNFHFNSYNFWLHYKYWEKEICSDT